MDFRILGPLEVWDGEERVPIRGRLHPRILAGLLLNNGRVVTLDWLVDLLWDDEPPETARRQAQNAVAALRRQLGAEGGGLIQAVPGGYRVDVADEAIDMRRFEATAARARGLARDGDDAEALRAFDAALVLWRGPALAGLTGRRLAAAAARLDEARLSTIEDRAEVAVRHNRAEQVLGELRNLVSQNPLRQRLTARLMAALRQLGRGDEALSVYERLRQHLSQELGLDPSSELTNLHRQLDHDGTRQHRPDAAAMPPTARVVPAQLPPDIATFTGRREHLAVLDRLLDTGSRVGIVSTITGIGGVGKTALTLHWGHARKDAFPDGQLYLNLRGFDEREPLSPYAAASRLLRSLDPSLTNLPDSVDEITARYRSMMTERRMLVLLDNARSSEQVRPLLTGGAGSLTLVTSRNRLSGLTALDDAFPVTVDALSPDESFTLLTELIGPDAFHDAAGVRRMADFCAQVPLALRIAAARLIQRPHPSISGFAAELAEASRLRLLRLGDDPDANITTVFDSSYSALSPDARRLFTRLALIPGEDFSRDLAAAIAATDEVELDLALDALVQARLLDPRGAGRFGFHDLIRLYAGERAREELSDVERDAAVSRMIDWYDVPKGGEQIPEFDNIVAASVACQGHPRSAKLALALYTATSYGHDVRLSRVHLERELRVAERRGEVDDQIQLLGALASTHSYLGDPTAAIALFRQAVAMLSDTEDLRVVGVTLGNFGHVLYGAGEYDEAEQHVRRALRIAEQLGEPRHISTRTANLGRIHRAQGRYEAAEIDLRRAVTITEELNGSRTNMARVSLGKLYLEMGRHEQAAAEVRRLLDGSLGAPTSRIESICLLILGEIAGDRLDLAEATSLLEQVLERAHRDGRFVYAIEANGLLAEVNAAVGDDDGARRHLARARDLYERSPHTSIEAELCRTATRVHNAAARFTEARDFGRRAVARFRALNSPLRLARSLDHLADAHTGLNQHAEAHTARTEAHEILTRLGVPEAERVAAKLPVRPPKP